MQAWIEWFRQVLDTSIRLYFRQECAYASIKEVPPPAPGEFEALLGRTGLSFEDRVVVMLALMPHLEPQALDIFFVQNKNFARPYTEFGGWKGISHGGFLPTGETAAFILAADDLDRRQDAAQLFLPDHWFHRDDILHLDAPGPGEPPLSGQLRISDEIISRVLYAREYRPGYSIGFPAERLTTQLEWTDLVLEYGVACDLDEINAWIEGHEWVMGQGRLAQFLKAGYRALFYGPPGTGKTLAATLVGKRNAMDVYRIDLSMIVSKYIGETEKNLARVFDMAENRRWILFFDEADALFGKRTSANTSNDRHANQEVAYLLQRIEDFPGTVILSTNLRSNIDEAFSRRFQSVVYFPMPTRELRAELWRKMLPAEWLGGDAERLIASAAETELSGGSIANVVRRCALHLFSTDTSRLEANVLAEALSKEKQKN